MKSVPFLMKIGALIFINIMIMSSRLSADENPLFYTVYTVDASNISTMSSVSDRTVKEKTKRGNEFNNDLQVLVPINEKFLLGLDIKYSLANTNCSGPSFGIAGGMFEDNMKAYIIGGFGVSILEEKIVRGYKQKKGYLFCKARYYDTYFYGRLVNGGYDDDFQSMDHVPYNGFILYQINYLLAARDVIPVCVKGSFTFIESQTTSSYSSAYGYESMNFNGYKSIGAIIKDYVFTAGISIYSQSADKTTYGTAHSSTSIYDHHFRTGFVATVDILNLFGNSRLEGEFHRINIESGRTQTISRIKCEFVW
jgi:hypothetical protein